MDSVLNQLRQAIESSGLSRYRICQESGIDKAHMSRLMSGERSLSIDGLETLADCLGLEIIIRLKRKGRK